jgi:hypothetical protein
VTVNLPLARYRLDFTVETPLHMPAWDLLRPKPAQRVAPVGSVYWYACHGKLADVAALKALLHNGLALSDAARRAEGFNHFHIAPWAKEN